MSKQQWKLLVCSIAALTLLVMGLFVSPWFDVDVVGTNVNIDLRTLTVCGLAKDCVTVSISGFKGFYPIAASAAFFVGIPVLVLVVIQAASRIVTGTASAAISKLGYSIAGIAMIAGVGAGFLFAPDSQGIDDVKLVEVSRTWAPVLFLVGNLLAMFSLYLAAAVGLDDDVAEYKPIKLDKHEHGRLPVTPLSVNRVSLAPHNSPSMQTETARRFTPSQGLQRVDDGNNKRYTPGGSPPLEDDGNKRYNVGDPNRRFTPSQQIRQIEDAGRTKSPSQGPAVARTSSPGLRPRTASQQPLQRPSDPNLRSQRPGSDPNLRPPRPGTEPGSDIAPRQPRAGTDPGTDIRPRTRAPSEHGVDAVDVGSRVQHLPVDTGVDVRIKQRPPSDPSIEVVRQPVKRPSDPGVEVRLKAPTQQPLVARTVSPMSQPLAGRTTSPTSQPLVARTTSPGAAADPRSKSASQQPLVARTTSPGAPASDPRPKSATQQPLVARTGSPRVADPRMKPPTPQSYGSGSRDDAHSIASITDSRTQTSAHQPLTAGDRAKSSSQQLFAARNALPGSDARTKPPTQQPLVARTASPTDPRTKAASQQPLVARTASPGIADPRFKPAPQGPISIDEIERSRTSSSGPIDLASRLTASAPQGVLEPLGLVGLAIGPPGAPLGAAEVLIRPPLPQPEPIPPDQIPVDPAAGLTIRKRTSSAVQMPVPASVLAATAAASASPTADAPPITLSTFPPYIQHKINYAALTVELSTSGLTATREDGQVKTIGWDSIVGVIARRLPPDKPYEGATIVDIVSEAGATVRVVPWTRVRGGLPLAEAPVARAREIVNLVASQALGAKLDAATKLFADSDGQAAQLPTVATLGTHDEHVA